MLNNRIHKCWEGIKTSCLVAKRQQLKSCAPSLLWVFLGAPWLTKHIQNKQLPKLSLLVLESCQGTVQRVSHSDSLIGVIHSVTSKTGEGGGELESCDTRLQSISLRSRDADFAAIEQNLRNTVTLLLLAVNLQPILLAFPLRAFNHWPWSTCKYLKDWNFLIFCVPESL